MHYLLSKDNAMDIKAIFWERVRSLRTEKGYSQEAFAVKCKVHRTYMGLIERGQTNLTIEQIEKIAKALGVSVEELFKGFK